MCYLVSRAKNVTAIEVKKRQLLTQEHQERSRGVTDARDTVIMAAIEVAFPLDGLPGKILKWRVRSDTMVAAGRVLLIYRNATPAVDDTAEPEKKLRATRFGRVKKLLVKEGDVVQPGYASFSQHHPLPPFLPPFIGGYTHTHITHNYYYDNKQAN